MKVKLNKCKCGGNAELKDDIEYCVGGYYVECTDCKAQTPAEILGEREAVEYWNKYMSITN